MDCGHTAEWEAGRQGCKKGGMDAAVGGGTVTDFKAGMVSTALSGSTADMGVRSTGPSSLSPARFS